jgi:hypothetical protein
MVGVFLSIPLQQLASARGATAIQWIKSFGMAVSCMAAAYILIKSPPSTEPIEKATKRRLLVFSSLVLGLILLGALIYFIPN